LSGGHKNRETRYWKIEGTSTPNVGNMWPNFYLHITKDF